ncbi:MAG: hypothetical protein ACO3JL_14465 [Myxococcota bacterium]|jgi:hypothetical protein
MPSLSRVYAWNVFVPSQKAWVHFRRSEMHGPGWWFSEARTQTGRVLATRTLSSEYAADLFSRYGTDAEITYFS